MKLKYTNPGVGFLDSRYVRLNPTASQTISGQTLQIETNTASSEALVLKSLDDNTTKNFLEARANDDSALITLGDPNAGQRTVTVFSDTNSRGMRYGWLSSNSAGFSINSYFTDTWHLDDATAPGFAFGAATSNDIMSFGYIPPGSTTKTNMLELSGDTANDPQVNIPIRASTQVGLKSLSELANL